MSYTGIDEKIWWQKYRPQTLDDVILPSSIKNAIIKYVRVDKKIPHLLFISSLPGSGKTTLAHAIINEMNAEHLKINASKDNGIAIIRTLIEPFATRESLYGEDSKIVWLDEADRLSDAMQEGLRGIMEEYSNSVQFILTGNNINGIITPVIDRCEVYDFNFSKSTVKNEIIIPVFNRVKYILDDNNISYTDDILVDYVAKNYPRIRHIISGLQRYATGNGNIIDSGILDSYTIDESFYQLILDGNFTKAKEMLIKTGGFTDQLFTDIYRKCLPNITNKNIYAPFLLTINKYAVQSTQVIDKELNAVALLMELSCLCSNGIK